MINPEELKVCAFIIKEKYIEIMVGTQDREIQKFCEGVIRGLAELLNALEVSDD